MSPIVPPTKICTKCGIEKPATEEYFYLQKRRSGKYSLIGRCKECIKAQTLQYYRDNPEKCKAQRKQYYNEHLEKHLENCRNWVERNPEKKKEIEKRYRDKHQKRCNESNQRWLNANPYKKREYTLRRRARKHATKADYNSHDIEKLYNSQKGLCWWCGKKLNGNYEIDHRIPISRGGRDSLNNICCSCRKCNRSKNDKLPHEWNGRLL